MIFINWMKKNYLNILLFIILLLIISPVILEKPLNNLDEVWNYNFARNIADGLIPYKDFNMVITPLLSFICGIFLKLFGNELIVMRILAIFLIAFIFFMIYLILKKLKVNIFYNFTILFLLFFFIKDYICIDYNYALLAITLILIYLSLNNNIISTPLKINYKLNFVIGCLSGCCILLKQSTGLIIAFISIISSLLLVKNKADFKTYIKNTCIQILGIFIPIFILLIYLLIHNALFEFIDYTILGIKTFTNSISYNTLLHSKNIVIKVLSITTPIFIIIIGIYLLLKKHKKLYAFYVYALGSLVVIFPISDNIHFSIGIIPFLILFAYLFFFFLNYINKKINWIKKYEKLKLFLYEFYKAINFIIIIIYLITSLTLLTNYLNNSNKKHNILHYSQIPISENLLQKINIIQNYILSQNNTVYILDAEAAIYMIPLNIYNKDFDMFNKGNLGSKGETGQIEKINNLPQGTKILIKNDKYSRNWQSPENVIKYIKNSFLKIGEINIFDIYEIN